MASTTTGRTITSHTQKRTVPSTTTFSNPVIMDDFIRKTRNHGNISYTEENGSINDEDNVLPQVVKAISIVLIAILVCGLNFLVAYTLHKKSYQLLQQIPGNRLIFSLAVSNCLFGAVVLPFNFMSCVCGDWIFGSMMCNCTGFITMTVFSGSMVSNVVITIDRYYAITQPLLYPIQVTSRRTKELIILTWLMSLLGSLPPLFGWSNYAWTKTTSSCFVQWDHNPSFAYTFTVVFILVPLSIVCYCYSRILKVARMTSRRTSNGNIASATEYNPAQRRRSRRTSLLVNIRMNSPTKAIRTVTVTIGNLLVTVGPLTVVIIYQAMRGLDTPSFVLVPATWLFFGSFVSNSCVYALWNKKLRRELIGYCCCAWGHCMDNEDDDDPLFQPRRKTSQAISISESISSDITGFVASMPVKRKSSVQWEPDDEIIDDSGTTMLKCVEDPSSVISTNLASTSCLTTSSVDSQPKATRRKRSPLSDTRSPYGGSEEEGQSMLPVVVEVAPHLPGGTADINAGV